MNSLAWVAAADQRRQHLADADREVAAADVQRHGEQHAPRGRSRARAPARPPDDGERPEPQGRAAGDTRRRCAAEARASSEHGHQTATILRRRTSDDEERSADQRQHDADLQLARTHDHPADDVGARAAARRRRAPDAGSSQRWSGPVNVRTTCGTTSPTNAIGPQAAVAAPVSRVIATMPATARASTESARGGGRRPRRGPSRFSAGALTSRQQQPDEEERQHLARDRRVPAGERADRPEPVGVERLDVDQDDRRGQRVEQGATPRPRPAPASPGSGRRGRRSRARTPRRSATSAPAKANQT